MLIAIVLQATTVVAPPAPPAPVIVTSAPRVSIGRSTEDMAGANVAVEVRGGGTLLYRGTMRVATNAQSSVRQTQSEPVGKPCGVAQGYRPPLETGLTLTLQPVRYDSNDGVVRVSVRWVRAGSEACPIAGVTRAAELNAMVDLSGGATVNLEGDGGLSIRLRQAS